LGKFYLKPQEQVREGKHLKNSEKGAFFPHDDEATLPTNEQHILGELFIEQLLSLK